MQKRSKIPFVKRAFIRKQYKIPISWWGMSRKQGIKRYLLGAQGADSPRPSPLTPLLWSAARPMPSGRRPEGPSLGNLTSPRHRHQESVKGMARAQHSTVTASVTSQELPVSSAEPHAHQDHLASEKPPARTETRRYQHNKGICRKI